MLYSVTGEVEILVEPDDGPLVQRVAVRVNASDDALRGDVLALALDTVSSARGQVVGWWSADEVVLAAISPRQVMAESGAAMLFEDCA